MCQNPISYFRKQAKQICKRAKAGEANVLARFAEHFPGRQPSVQRAQHIIAKEGGFCSWQELLTADDDKAQLAAVIHFHPLLCDHGMGTMDHWRLSLSEQKQNLARDRRQLRKSVDEVVKTRSWLRSNVAKIKTINRQAHSYRLKHLAEMEIGYITNGVLIAAAILEEYREHIRYGDPNVEFAMSERSLKAIRKRSSRQ